MPAVIALILRQIIMSIATGAVVTGAQELLDGTIKELVFELKDSEGITEQDAKDVIGNILIDLAVNSATIFTVLKSGFGVKAAEWLGLTSRGFAKKKLVFPASSVVSKLVTSGGGKIATGALTKILKIAAIPGTLIWLASALANIIEPGIYKPEQTNALYKKLGIPFQYPTNAGSRKAGLLETSEFNALADSLEKAGIKGIENPVALQSQPYSRDGLMDIIDYITGQEVLKNNKATAGNIRALLGPYLVTNNGASAYVPTTNPSTTSVSVSPITKVFTGIVSQGVVGKGLIFTPRPDDMIDSADELRQAAANNLAPYLNALLGKIVYEVKVVSSIITKEGFRQSGTTQQIQTGTNANGTPKYKTVTNKFATLVVYALTDKGSRAKLTTIVLGPTNSAKLAVSQNDMRAIEAALPAEVTTTDVNEIAGIETSNPITVSTPPPAKETAPAAEQSAYWVILIASGKKYQIGPFSKKEDAKAIALSTEKLYSTVRINANYEINKGTNPGLSTWTGDDLKGKGVSVPVPDATPVVTKPAIPATGTGASASTLSEWYQAQGQKLPTVEERSKLYASLGLGQASYYTGTAEQNTKLLNALKAK